MEGRPGPWRTGVGSVVLLGLLCRVLSGFWISESVGLPSKEETSSESTRSSADKVSQSQAPGVRDKSDLIVELRLLLEPKEGWVG